MTPKEIQVLMKACKAAGIDATKIKPENPFSKNGKTADLLQVAVAEIDPQLAAKWRVEAGAGVSIATLTEQQSGLPLSDTAKQDLYLHDPEFVSSSAKQQEKGEAELMAWLDKEADKSRRAREGDEAVDFQNAKAQAVAEARAASAQHAADMQRRIDEKRAAQDRLAGVFTNG